MNPCSRRPRYSSVECTPVLSPGRLAANQLRDHCPQTIHIIRAGLTWCGLPLGLVVGIGISSNRVPAGTVKAPVFLESAADTELKYHVGPTRGRTLVCSRSVQHRVRGAEQGTVGVEYHENRPETGSPGREVQYQLFPSG